MKATERDANSSCDDGFRHVDDRCEKVVAPEHAYVRGHSWLCYAGFRRVDDHCEKVIVPEHAYLRGSDWFCYGGFRRVDDHCEKVAARNHSPRAGSRSELGTIPDARAGRGTESASSTGARNDSSAAVTTTPVEVSHEAEKPLAAVSWSPFNRSTAAVWIGLFSLVLIGGGVAKALRARQASEGARSDYSERADSGQHAATFFDPYAVLGVAETATETEIRAAYRDGMAKYHPDKVAHLGDELQELAARKAQDLNRALDELMRSSRSRQ